MINSVKSPCDEGVIRSAPVAAHCQGSGLWILVATILGSSMAFIDGSVVNIALPVVQRELNATSIDVQWVMEAYLLFLSAFLLVGGSLGDHLGRRRVFACGIAIFTLASIWCGLSANVSQLIVARGVQGLGGALLVPGSLSIISASFDGEQRGWAIGTWSGFTAVTSVIGPVLGGWLVAFASWRWIFFINVPLAAIVLVVLFWHVPESRDKGLSGGLRELDWQGTSLVTLGLAGIVYGLIEAGTLGLDHPLVLGVLAIGVIALVAFLFVEAHVQHPIVPLSLFRSRTFSGANLLTLLLYAALAATAYFLPFNLIQVQGYSDSCGWGSPGTFRAYHVPALTLGGRAKKTLRYKIPTHCWADGSGSWFCSLCYTRHWRQLLDDLFPSGNRDEPWNDDNRCAFDNYSDECRRTTLLWHRLRYQQYSFSHRRSACYRGYGYCDVEYFQ